MLTLCGTYTLDPVGDVVGFWADFLGVEIDVRLLPYGQLFQQLLDPSSVLRRNEKGGNALLLRWSDLLPLRSLPAGAQLRELDRCVDDLARALNAFAHQVPCLVLVGPSDARDPALEQATSRLEALLADTAYVAVERGGNAMARYDVRLVDDPVSDRFGHVPFTTQAIAALGTTIARWYCALERAPVKLVAVDADNTLWSGVVAEDGVDQVRVDPARIALQRALVRQHDCGRLLCLLSKNEEPDVRAVFERHPGMALRWRHFVARRIDWTTKPENLESVLSELGLGPDSVVFLDDNPVECAQMRARRPEVLTIQVPTDPERLERFSAHLWLFDVSRTTDEDRGRVRMYRDHVSRAELRRQAESLQSFLDSLELVVEIEAPTQAEVPRLAQLSHRTNQFNASLERCEEATLRNGMADVAMFHRLVRARDRFGDYGVVGQLRARETEDCLLVDLFMLSCRALGRGIEHRMLAAVGARAVALGLCHVDVRFRGGERNAPARRFLEQVSGMRLGSNDHAFRLPAALAAAVEFDPSAIDHAAQDPGRAVAAATSIEDLRGRDLFLDRAARYEHIAHALTTAASIEAAMIARVRPRGEFGAAFMAPAPGLERDIAAIWQKVLRIEPIGSQDRFQDLGGKSIHLVQVHSLLLQQLNVELDLASLFQHPTVSALATHLSSRTAVHGTGEARHRGLLMREARARSARRSGVAS